MYTIKKYVDAWVIINDDTGQDRVLTGEEALKARKIYPDLADEKVKSIIRDTIEGIDNLP